MVKARSLIMPGSCLILELCRHFCHGMPLLQMTSL